MPCITFCQSPLLPCAAAAAGPRARNTARAAAICLSVPQLCMLPFAFPRAIVLSLHLSVLALPGQGRWCCISRPCSLRCMSLMSLLPCRQHTRVAPLGTWLADEGGRHRPAPCPCLSLWRFSFLCCSPAQPQRMPCACSIMSWSENSCICTSAAFASLITIWSWSHGRCQLSQLQHSVGLCVSLLLLERPTFV